MQLNRLKIAVIILAAGSSRRMKTPKQFLEYKGKYLLQHSVDLAAGLEVCERVLVTGPHYERIVQDINYEGFEVVRNKFHEQGMSSSLQEAIRFLKDTELDAVLVMLCDQPLIPKTHYEALIKMSQDTDNKIITTSYKDTFGVPTLFKSSLFEEILALGKKGAKSLIFKYKKDVSSIPCEEAEFDIDTPEDYKSLNSA